MTFVHGQTGSSSILSAPANTQQRLSELEQLLGITRQNTEQATELPVSRLRTRLGLTSSKTEPITEQLDELTRQLNELGVQVNQKLSKLGEQLELTQAAKAISAELQATLDRVADRVVKLEQKTKLHNHWLNPDLEDEVVLEIEDGPIKRLEKRLSDLERKQKRG